MAKEQESHSPEVLAALATSVFVGSLRTLKQKQRVHSLSLRYDHATSYAEYLRTVYRIVSGADLTTARGRRKARTRIDAAFQAYRSGLATGLDRAVATAVSDVVRYHSSATIKAGRILNQDGVAAAKAVERAARNAIRSSVRNRDIGIRSYKSLFKRQTSRLRSEIDRLLADVASQGLSGKEAADAVTSFLGRSDDDVVSAASRLSGRDSNALAKAVRKTSPLRTKKVGQVKGAYYRNRLRLLNEVEQIRHEAKRLAFAANPATEYVRWRLSDRHDGLRTSPDGCDYLAGQDIYGYGTGVYHSQYIPIRPHQLCECDIVPVIRADWSKKKRKRPQFRRLSEADVINQFGGPLSNRMIDDIDRVNRAMLNAI